MSVLSGRHGVLLSWAALLALPLAAPAQAEQSLYARMGGAPVVQAFVNETVDRMASNPLTKHQFEGSNLRRIKSKLAEQVCLLSGGGCAYTGDSIKDSHANHHISEAEFYTLVDILRSSMREHHVHLRERNELLALFAPMKRDVVEPPAPRGAS